MVSKRMRIGSLALLSGLRTQRCCKLRRRSQMCLGSGMAVAVAVAGSCSSFLTPSLGTSICLGCDPKKKKEKEKKKRGTISHQGFFKKFLPRSAWTPTTFFLNSLSSFTSNLKACVMETNVRGMSPKCIRSLQLPCVTDKDPETQGGGV